MLELYEHLDQFFPVNAANKESAKLKSKPKKQVSFVCRDKVKIIERIPDEYRSDVYETEYYTMNTADICKEVNHIKLFMEIHPMSRQNTSFYSTISNDSELKICAMENCLHSHLL